MEVPEPRTVIFRGAIGMRNGVKSSKLKVERGKPRRAAPAYSETQKLRSRVCPIYLDCRAYGAGAFCAFVTQRSRGPNLFRATGASR
jgi:hypothetical protein